MHHVQYIVPSRIGSELGSYMINIGVNKCCRIVERLEVWLLPARRVTMIIC
jgi:hypothetical protein